MIAKLSANIAKFIRNNNAQAASMEVLMFTLEVVLNATLVTLVILLIALVTGQFGEAVIMLASYLALRYFSGGAHLPTSKLCNISSVGIFIALMFLPVSYWNVGFLLNLLAFFLVFVYAPTKDIMQLNRLGPKYTMHFKILSLGIVALNFWIQSPLIALAFITQTLSITPAAYKAVSYLERR